MISRGTDINKFAQMRLILEKKLGDDSEGSINPLSTKPIKWPNTLKQFVGKLPMNCLSVFDGFVGLALKG